MSDKLPEIEVDLDAQREAAVAEITELERQVQVLTDERDAARNEVRDLWMNLEAISDLCDYTKWALKRGETTNADT